LNRFLSLSVYLIYRLALFRHAYGKIFAYRFEKEILFFSKMVLILRTLPQKKHSSLRELAVISSTHRYTLNPLIFDFN